MTIRVNLPIGPGAGLGEGGEKAFTAGVIAEVGFPAVAAIQDVIDRAGMLNAQCAGHDPVLRPLEIMCLCISVVQIDFAQGREGNAGQLECGVRK